MRSIRSRCCCRAVALVTFHALPRPLSSDLSFTLYLPPLDAHLVALLETLCYFEYRGRLGNYNFVIPALVSRSFVCISP